MADPTDFKPRVIVLGAGVVGLSTAVRCQQTWPTALVTVMADKFGPETTSYGPGGIFRPTFEKVPGVDKHRLKKWLRDSWKHFHGLAHSESAKDTGVNIVSFYQFYNSDAIQSNELEEENVYNYRKLTPKELNMFPGIESAKHGFFVTTLAAEGAFYTQYLMQRFTDAGGLVKKRKVSSLTELTAECDLLFNCTGLGSRELLGDDKLIPIRGQLIKVRAPWIKHAVLYGDDQSCFIYPGRDQVVVGVTRQVGDYNLEINQADSDKMWADAVRIVPSLEKAARISEWVGLRPFRVPLRLEKELLRFSDNSSLKVVHNYGHGSDGIGLSWGTAGEALQLASEMMREDSPLLGVRNDANRQNEHRATSKL